MDANSFYLSSTAPIRSFKELLANAKPIERYKEYKDLVLATKKYVDRRKFRKFNKLSLEDIKEIPLAEVIERYIKHVNDFDAILTCKCPFHEDSNPSLTIYKESNTFICRGSGCGKHGDVIQFVQYADGVSFSEACRRLKEGTYGV